MQTTSVIIVLWQIAMFWNAEANVLPNITIPEAEQIYILNEDDNITCAATGYPVPDIVWLNNDGSQVDENRLVINNVMATATVNLSSVSVSMIVTRNDTGVYMCVANNSVGNDTNTITILVQLAPAITTPDTKRTYNITDGDSITCTATGYPVPDIVWLNDDGSEVDENRLISGSVMTTGIDNIPSVSVSMIIRRSDGGIYKCVANNSLGNDTSTIHITVQHKDCCGEPDILLTADCTTNKFVQLKWKSRLRSRFRFCVRYKCNADDSVDYCQATQHCYTGFNPEIYDETTQTYLGEVPVVIPDNTSCCFWVENNEYRHDLSRGCSKLFCCNNESQLMPNITMPEAKQVYIITEDDNITCTATGYPVPDIVWLNNDGSVVNESRLVTDSVMTTDIGNLSSVSVSMLVTRNDAGVYMCVANNTVGNDTITIFVQLAPAITTPDTKQAYNITDGDSITCTATGYPVPDIVWLNEDGSEVDENRLISGSVMTTDIDNIPSVSVSMIIRRSDGGIYKCLANNSLGNDNSTIHINVQHKDCCGEPDILLTADCTTNKFVQLKWKSRLTSRFSFCIIYECNADDSVDYCQATQHCYSGFNPHTFDETTQTYMGEVPVVVPDNTSCCFWVENTEYRNDLSRGCSKLICCNNESQPIVENNFNRMTSSTLPPTPVTPSEIPATITSVSPSLSETSSETMTSPVASTLNPSSQSPPAPHTSVVVNTSSIASSPSVSPSKLPDSPRLYIILFCVIFIFMVLLSTICICLFLFWWKKSKRKNTELEITVKTQIEKYFDDTDDLPKDCISEVEVVIDNKDHNDGISIAEDVSDILAMISYKRQTSLSSIMSIINSEEHDGIADISESATTHYCNGGSAGSHSNTSSQRASFTSATPLSTDT